MNLTLSQDAQKNSFLDAHEDPSGETLFQRVGPLFHRMRPFRKLNAPILMKLLVCLEHVWVVHV